MLTYALIDSPNYLDFPALYAQHQIQLTRFKSTRQLNKAIAKAPPDLLIGEFFYGYGNNYAGINISNLDVSLHTLRRYASQAKVIVLADKNEASYVEELAKLFQIDAHLSHPVREADLAHALVALSSSDEQA